MWEPMKIQGKLPASGWEDGDSGSLQSQGCIRKRPEVLRSGSETKHSSRNHSTLVLEIPKEFQSLKKKIKQKQNKQNQQNQIQINNNKTTVCFAGCLNKSALLSFIFRLFLKPKAI